jgi:hypothetical protein
VMLKFVYHLSAFGRGRDRGMTIDVRGHD